MLSTYPWIQSLFHFKVHWNTNASAAILQPSSECIAVKMLVFQWTFVKWIQGYILLSCMMLMCEKHDVGLCPHAAPSTTASPVPPTIPQSGEWITCRPYCGWYHHSAYTTAYMSITSYCVCSSTLQLQYSRDITQATEVGRRACNLYRGHSADSYYILNTR